MSEAQMGESGEPTYLKVPEGREAQPVEEPVPDILAEERDAIEKAGSEWRSSSETRNG